jgi:hypothetical protein
MTFKWLTVPASNDTRQVEAVQLWEVRWESRYGKYSNDTRPEVEAFTSQDEADKFADALRAALVLLRTTSGTKVTVAPRPR